MKIKDGRISILINRDFTTIELIDATAGITFAEVRLTPEQLSSALSRMGHTHCEIELRGMQNVGKKHEHTQLVFELPGGVSRWGVDKEVLIKEAEKHLPEGWISDNSFNSQGSFFMRDGKEYASTTIRRWVDDDQENKANL